MLKPAGLYESELQLLDMKKCYANPFYQYYYGDGTYSPLSVTDNDSTWNFVSVNDEEEILGYIGFTYDQCSSCAKWWGIKSYKSSVTFVKDVLRVVDDVFNKFNLNRIEWFCYADNPAVRGYEKFIKRCGGERVAHLHQERKLMDGKFHDTYIYEILKENYKPVKF